MAPAIWRVLAKAHNDRNLAEYEGYSEVDEQLLSDLFDCTAKLEAEVLKLDPPAKSGREHDFCGLLWLPVLPMPHQASQSDKLSYGQILGSRAQEELAVPIDCFAVTRISAVRKCL